MILSMYNFISNYWGNRGKPCISLKTSAFPVSKETLNCVLFNANLNLCKFHFGNKVLNWIKCNGYEVSKINSRTTTCEYFNVKLQLWHIY